MSNPEWTIHGLLQSYLTLSHNWDGEDGIPVTQEAVSAAQEFSKLCTTRQIVPHECSPLGDGSVSLYWEKSEPKGYYAEVWFTPDGQAHYFIQTSKEKKKASEQSALQVLDVLSQSLADA